MGHGSLQKLGFLLKIKSFFNGVGRIKIDKVNNKVQYTVTRIKDLNTVIIPHFKNYILMTQKRADFNLFNSIIDKINKKEHLTRKSTIF